MKKKLAMMTNLNMKGHALFITLEGGEGAGKSTLLTKLQAGLQAKGHEVVITREPGGTLLGQKIRHWLLHQNENIAISAEAELLLFLSDRAQHIQEVILPALNEGKIVICDRFNDSTIAYQGYARGLDVSYIENLCKLVCKGILPTLTFLLDIDPKKGLERSRRIEKECAPEGFFDKIESESLQFHQRVREGLCTLAFNEPERIHIIDAELSKDLIYNEALEVILKRLSQKDSPCLKAS